MAGLSQLFQVRLLDARELLTFDDKRICIIQELLQHGDFARVRGVRRPQKPAAYCADNEKQRDDGAYDTSAS